MSDQQDQSIACDPTAIHPDEREAHGLLTKELFSLSTVLETKELPDGYGFRLPLDTTMLHKAVKWIVNERLCCPFFTFTMIVDEQLWIELNGPKGAKDLINQELLSMLESSDFPALDGLMTYDEASANSTN